MQGIYDFLMFKSFISPTVLYLFYYIGAVGIPVAAWIFSLWIREKYWFASEFYKNYQVLTKKLVNKSYRLRFFMLFVLLFIFLEVLYRMMFEFLIAYFQIREALLGVGL